MRFDEIFGKAKYVQATDNYFNPYVRKSFFVNGEIKSAKLIISILGFAEIYLNGKKITDDLYITTNSQYHRQKAENCSRPEGLPYFDDELSFTIYASQFDLKDFIKKGKNAFGVIVANGWYWSNKDKYGNLRAYGQPKVAFRIIIEKKSGEIEEIISNTDTKWSESFLTDSGVYHEEQDERKEIFNFSTAEFDDSAWKNMETTLPPEAEYLFEDGCPRNKVIEYAKAKLVKQTENEKIFALDINFTGYPIIEGESAVGDIITCKMGELLDENGDLEEFHSYNQNTIFVSDGRKKHHLRFTWHGFQYISIATTGDLSKLTVKECALVHADIKNTSEFETDNNIINFIYDAYIRSQLQNYQCGVPIDCPQIERRGYTGDGQLLGELGMLLFDSKLLYKKWMRDIADTQDKKTGYVDYTAPSWFGCAGGPGGWSVAIINVPYEYYKRYGDTEPLKTYYQNMLKYVQYMDIETENGLINIHNRKNCRCLGDWSGPYKPFLPEPFVNTCLYIEALNYLIEISKVIGKDEEIPALEQRIKDYKIAVDNTYLDKNTGDYCNNEQGSNAFALNAGLGDERTLNNLNNKYQELKGFDVGIFGLKMLPKILFKNGFGDTALSLYTSENKISFKSMMDEGATTLLEAWENARSRNHPMYGVVVLYLFEYVLGIRQQDFEAGYKKLVINPLSLSALGYVKGSILLDEGKVSVEYKKENGCTKFKVQIPSGIDAKFIFNDKEFALKSGENTFII